jgi:multidrug efflux system membrane fusion protein
MAAGGGPPIHPIMTSLVPQPAGRPAPRPRPPAASAPALRVGPALLAILALAAGCSGGRKPPPPRVSVAVATVVERPMPVALAATGTVEPVEEAKVGSQVGGVVTRIAFREGDDVAAGQVLIELDPRPFQAVLDQALGGLARDRAQAQNARLEAERAERLLERQLIPQSELDQKRAAAAAYAAAMQADSATVAAARLDLHYASIRAPISGRSGEVTVRTGDLVRAATSDPLVTINRIHPVRVRFTVPESDVPLVQRYRDAGPRVRVRSGDGDSLDLEGRLVFVDNAVDEASGTLLLKGEFPNSDGRLTPGQFVDARLVLYVEPRAVTVPAPAVSSGQRGTYVYVVNADSTATTRSVEIERIVDEIAVVKSGLKPGETVITDGQLRLSPGARVTVRPAVAARP